MNTRQHFEELLDSYSDRLAVPSEIFTGSVEEVLERISRSKGKVVRSEIDRFLRQERLYIKNRSVKNLRRTDLSGITEMNIAREMTLLCLLNAANISYSDKVPKLHHWIPVCYLKNFTATRKANSARIVELEKIQFSPRTKVAYKSTIKDLEFCHGVDVNGNGFYHRTVEQFFGLTESFYSDYITNSEARGDLKKDFYNGAMVAFIVALAVRNPYAEAAQPEVQTMSGLIKALIHLFDTLGESNIYIEKSLEKVPFSPNISCRIRKAANGNVSFYFPLADDTAMVISPAKMNVDQVRATIRAGRASMINQARNNAGAIYGISFNSLKNS